MARLGVTAIDGVGSRPDDGDDAEVPQGWPQEVRKLLFDANREASALRAERQSLLAHVDELERSLEEAKAEIAALREQTAAVAAHQHMRAAPAKAQRPDQEWLQEVTERTSSALRSGQQTAQAIVERAHHRAGELEEEARRKSIDVRRRAEAEAAKLLSVAQYDAEGLLQGAQASANELLAQAHEHREEIVADLRRRQGELRSEISRLEAGRLELLETYAAIRRPVDDAIRALQQPTGRAPGNGVPRPQPRIRDAVAARWAQRTTFTAGLLPNPASKEDSRQQADRPRKL